jgi:hypothetical protein
MRYHWGHDRYLEAILSISISKLNVCTGTYKNTNNTRKTCHISPVTLFDMICNDQNYIIKHVISLNG